MNESERNGIGTAISSILSEKRNLCFFLNARHLNSITSQSFVSWPLKTSAIQLAEAGERHESETDLLCAFAFATLNEVPINLLDFRQKSTIAFLEVCLGP